VLFVNVGSVGKPKDRDVRACYAVLETTQLSVTLRRVPYDVASAAHAIRQTSLPARFARDLELAGAPEPAGMA
jgi:diadenosine tetraphosphatase ApaH/serine/threonine PP2A family protein phosphatase